VNFGLCLSIIFFELRLFFKHFFLKRIMGKHEPDYYGLLVIGLMFIILGITFDGNTKPVFILTGIIFLIASLVNKDKWMKNKKHKK